MVISDDDIMLECNNNSRDGWGGREGGGELNFKPVI